MLVLSIGLFQACGKNSIVNLRSNQLGLEWDQSQTIDMGLISVGSYSTQKFTLQNKSQNTASNCQAVELSDVINFSVQTTTCGSTMAPNSSCDVMVEASPASAGFKDLSLRVKCDLDQAPAAPVTRAKVEAVVTDISWSPTSTRNFGNVAISEYAASTYNFTLSNNGSQGVTGCGAVTLSNPTDFEISSDNCTNPSLSASSTCFVTVRAKPMASGVRYTSITRTCAESGVVSTQLSKTKVTGVTPLLSVFPLDRNFGNVDIGSTSSQLFTFSNGSSLATARNCSAPTLSNNTDFILIADSCSTNDLVANSSCNINVRAQPQSLGVKKTTLSRTCVIGGAVSTTQDQIIVTGVTPTPNLSWSPLSYNYGSVYTSQNSSTVLYTLSNTGAAAATSCGLPTISNATDFTIVSDTCQLNNLSVSSTCQIGIRANPSSVGLKRTTLSRTCSFGGITSTTTDGIQVTGTTPPSPNLAWSTSTYDYGDVRNNEGSLPTTITLTNSGAGAATSCSAPILSDSTNFSIIEDNCSTSNLNAAASCTVKVQANPTTSGAKVTSLSRTCTFGGTVTTGNGIVANGFSLPGNTIMKVVGGAHHTCAMNFDGGVKCWGTPGKGQMGYNEVTSRGHTPETMSTLPEVFLGAGRKARDIAAGYEHTCALLDDHTMKCWGDNSNGQLGVGDNLNRGHQAGSMESLNPINVGVGRLVKKIATGNSHTCAILDNDTLKCWGRNFTGALGMGVGDLNAPHTNPINFGANTVKEVAAGYIYTCALLNDNSIKCFGYNSSGQLGVDNTSDQALPGAAVNLAGHTAKKLAAGYMHMCAILDNDAVKCWGSNSIGQSGVENNTNYGATAGSMATLPEVMLGGGRTAKSIAAFVHHTCALLDNDTMKCWGHNAYGQLGIDNAVSKGAAALDMQNLLPINLGVGRTARGIMASAFASCAILDNNTLKCWGNNATGRLGYGDTSDRGKVGPGFSIYDLLAINVGVSLTVKEVAVGNMETCAIMSDNSLKCWGSNWNGKLGYNDTADRGKVAGDMASLPSVYLGVGRSAVKVTIGWHHTCAILDNGAVKCWGYNNNGQLGTNDTTSRGNVPGSMEALGEVYLGAGRTAVDIQAGYQHSCALLDDGTVKCWGWNISGQLGQNDKSNRGSSANSMQSLLPVYLGVGRTAVSMSSGWQHVCVILDDTSLKCWGSNSTGELGYDETDPFMGEGQHGGYANSMQSLAAVNVGAGRYAVNVSAGQSQTCVVLDNGSAKCWGHGLQGNLGTGSSYSYGKLPGDMASLPAINLGVGRTAQKISSGYAYTCALLDNNTTKCWGGGGMSSSSPLGYNNLTQLYAPVGPIVFRGNLAVKKIVAAPAIQYGYGHTCVIFSDDSLTCFGYNGSGQLGVDDSVSRGHEGYSVTNTMPHGYTP